MGVDAPHRLLVWFVRYMNLRHNPIQEENVIEKGLVRTVGKGARITWLVALNSAFSSCRALGNMRKSGHCRGSALLL